MAQDYEVVIKLVSNKAPCHNGHKVGQEWGYKNEPPQGMCQFAYNSIYPFLMVITNGGKFPWQTDPDVITACCPDPEVGNVFELRRREKKARK